MWGFFSNKRFHSVFMEVWTLSKDKEQAYTQEKKPLGKSVCENQASAMYYCNGYDAYKV